MSTTRKGANPAFQSPFCFVLCFFPCEAGAGFSPRPLPAHMSLCVKQNKAEYGEFPGGPVVKNLATNAGDTGLILGLGRVHVL